MEQKFASHNSTEFCGVMLCVSDQTCGVLITTYELLSALNKMGVVGAQSPALTKGTDSYSKLDLPHMVLESWH